MLSQSERSLKGVFCAIDTACGMESVIQKLANSAPGSVNLLHDSWGNTAWVTKRLIVAAPRARSAWKEGRRRLHFPLAEDASGLIRTLYPGFLSQILSYNFSEENKAKRQDTGQRACYKARYLSWPTVGQPHIGNMHSA